MSVVLGSNTEGWGQFKHRLNTAGAEVPPSSQCCPPATLPPRIHSCEVPEDTPGMPTFPGIPGSCGPQAAPECAITAVLLEALTQLGSVIIPFPGFSQNDRYSSVRLVSITWLCCCRVGETESVQESSTLQNTTLLSSGTLHLPTVVCLLQSHQGRHLL